METLLQDLRFALRGLIRNPGFSVVAITSIGLGIGVNSAIFSNVYQILMRPLPFADAHRLVEVRTESASDRLSWACVSRSELGGEPFFGKSCPRRSGSFSSGWSSVWRAWWR